MKKSFYFLAILIVLSLFATLFYVVFKFVDAANAGLHGTF
jgi:hypothetical protein